LKGGDMKKKVSVLLICFILLISFVLIFAVREFKEKITFPIFQSSSLSEKDVNLIEEFVKEMNLLNAILYSDDNRAFEAQLAKVKAAGNNLSDLGSSETRMSIMFCKAMDVERSYEYILLYSNEKGHRQEYKSSLENASQSHRNFLELYQMIKRGATSHEFFTLVDKQTKSLL
jgi:hypothetical protein